MKKLEAFIRQPVSVLCMVIGNPVLHGLAAGRDHGIFEGVSIADQLLVEQIHLLTGRYDVLNGHKKPSTNDDFLCIKVRSQTKATAWSNLWLADLLKRLFTAGLYPARPRETRTAREL